MAADAAVLVPVLMPVLVPVADGLAQTARALGSHALALFLALLLLLPAAGLGGRRLLRTGSAAGGRAGGRLDTRIGIAAAALGMAVFATLATLLLTGDGLRAADQAFAVALRASVPPAVLPYFAAVTHLADTATLTVLCTTLALLMAACRQPALALGWVLAVAGNGVLNRSLKALFGRARPLGQDAAWAEVGFSFPSGHSSGAVVACGMLAYTVFWLLPARWHAAALASALALAWSVGASRVFLGVHFASDVIAGFASGAVWLLLCIGGLALWRAWRDRPA